MGIEIDGDLARWVENLKYTNHDVGDLTKFLKFGLDKYMKPIPQPLGIILL